MKLIDFTEHLSRIQRIVNPVLAFAALIIFVVLVMIVSGFLWIGLTIDKAFLYLKQRIKRHKPMALTESQRTTLALDIRNSTDPDVIAALGIRNDTEITRLYNLDSSPAFVVWRESIEPDEYREALDWTEVDNLTAGKARIWEWITQNMTFSINASKLNVRQGLNNAFQTSNNSKSGLLAIAKETASRAEKLFATGNGTDGNPGVRTFVGQLTTQDVGIALNENP